MKPILLLDEAHYAQQMREIVLPTLSAQRREQALTPEDGVTLRVYLHVVSGSTQCVVLSHGFTESAEKFAELTYYLLQQGVSVVTYDQRGHGRSTRLNRDPSTVYVRHFDDYVRDLHSIVTWLRQEPALRGVELLLLGHSMGGGVAARALEIYPDDFTRCVLTSPMIGINTLGVPVWLSKLLAAVPQAVLLGKKRFLVHKPYAPGEAFDKSCATSRARFDYYAELRAATPAYQTNAASYRWIWEALRAHDRLMRPSALAAIRVPVLIFRAGLDGTVDNDATVRFARAVPTARLIDVPNAKHEIYRSPNADLAPYLSQLFGFLIQ